MSLILGFGSAEVSTAKRIIAECADAAAEKRGGEIKVAFDAVASKYAAVEAANSKLDAATSPDRYSTFWASIIPTFGWTDDEQSFVAIFHFLHINRRHAMSPDGWGCMTATWVLLSSADGRQIFREA